METLKMKRLDLLNRVFNRLTAIALDTQRCNSKRSYWLCLCKCGNMVSVLREHLISNKIRSCKCLLKEANWLHGEATRDKRTKLYGVFNGMKQRCSNPRRDSYKDYGGRGVTVCDEWKNSFEIFRDWSLNNGYKEGLEIDRINNNGSYEPSNCRFVTHKENNRNRGDNYIIVLEGKEICFSEAIDKYAEDKSRSGIKRVWHRVKKRSWDFFDAIKLPPRSKNPKNIGDSNE